MLGEMRNANGSRNVFVSHLNPGNSQQSRAWSLPKCRGWAVHSLWPLNACRRYHQYKFIVDGEWRHDELQPYMPDPLGNVNNWLFVRRMDSQQQPQQASQGSGPTTHIKLQQRHITHHPCGG